MRRTAQAGLFLEAHQRSSTLPRGEYRDVKIGNLPIHSSCDVGTGEMEKETGSIFP